jgi:hypothetical protein
MSLIFLNLKPKIQYAFNMAKRIFCNFLMEFRKKNFAIKKMIF